MQTWEKKTMLCSDVFFIDYSLSDNPDLWGAFLPTTTNPYRISQSPINGGKTTVKLAITQSK